MGISYREVLLNATADTVPASYSRGLKWRFQSTVADCNRDQRGFECNGDVTPTTAEATRL